MVIKVLPKHIKKGEHFSPCKCPVALAMIDIFSCTVEVYSMFVCLNGYNISLPTFVTYRINLFDCGRDIGPFEFELDLRNGPPQFR